MATKTITTTVTLHGPGPDHAPFKTDAGGSRLSGNYDPMVYPPGTEVTLEAKEADHILKRFGGSEITADGERIVDAAPAVVPKATGDAGKPGGPKA